jgi:hypothetical protein|tara:strand:- start:398 stop:649 length:252 start_codon:yes stop_codon:yes gene_type:complete
MQASQTHDTGGKEHVQNQECENQVVAVALMAIVALSSAPMESALADGPNLAPNPSFENGWACSQNCGIPCTEISDDLSFGWRK